MSQHEVVELVRSKLKQHDSERLHIEVLEDGIWLESGHLWHIPVRPTNAFPRTYEYYDTLSLVEDELLENGEMTVLLVPSA